LNCAALAELARKIGVLAAVDGEAPNKEMIACTSLSIEEPPSQQVVAHVVDAEMPLEVLCRRGSDDPVAVGVVHQDVDGVEALTPSAAQASTLWRSSRSTPMVTTSRFPLASRTLGGGLFGLGEVTAGDTVLSRATVLP
jgi:hypothetical protein